MVRWLPFVAATLAALIWLPAAALPFADTAEPQEALVVREMARSGDWILPRVNGEAIPSKPPLYHWIALAFSAIHGRVDELTARLPSIVCAAITVGLVFAVAASEWRPVAAVVAATALATAPEWTKWAITARTDTTFAFCLTAALLVGAVWLRSGSPLALLALAAATAAAVLAKGIAGALLVGAFLAVEVGRRPPPARPRPLPLVAAAGLFATIAGTWYAAAFARGGAAFFEKQIVSENVLRFLPSETGGPSRDHSPLFYLPMIALGMVPWSLALPHALYRAGRSWRARDATLPATLFTWFAVVFLACSAASGKRTNYVLPLYPAAALLLGWDFATVTARMDRRMSGPSAAAAIAGAVGLVAIAAGLSAWRLGHEPWKPFVAWLHPRDRVTLPQISSLLGAPPAAAIAGVLAAAGALGVAARRRSWAGVAAVVALVTTAATLFGTTEIAPLESRLKSFAPFAQRVAARVGSDERLAFLGDADFSVLFYLRRRVPATGRGLDELARPGWVLVREGDWRALPAEQRDAATVLDESPPASPAEPSSRLLLVRLEAPAAGPR